LYYFNEIKAELECQINVLVLLPSIIGQAAGPVQQKPDRLTGCHVKFHFRLETFELNETHVTLNICGGIIRWLECLAQDGKILGLCPSHIERPL